MKKTTTTIWDPAVHLTTIEDAAVYLEAALQDADPQVIAAALGDIPRTKAMTQIAREAGVGRECLYKSLSATEKPRTCNGIEGNFSAGSTTACQSHCKAKMAV